MPELYDYAINYTFDNDYKVFRDSLRTIIIDYNITLSEGYMSKETGYDAFKSDPKNVWVKYSSLSINIKYFHNSYLKNYLDKQNSNKINLKKIDSISKEKAKKRILKI